MSTGLWEHLYNRRCQGYEGFRVTIELEVANNDEEKFSLYHSVTVVFVVARWK